MVLVGRSVGLFPITAKSLAGKTGSAMILAATSDAIVGATATIVVGLLAAISAILVAFIQATQNRKRDQAVEEVVKLTKQLGELERARANYLANELRRRGIDLEAEGDLNA